MTAFSILGFIFGAVALARIKALEEKLKKLEFALQGVDSSKSADKDN